MLPRTIVWEDGLKYDIDRVIDIRPAYAAKAGGQGDRYTIQEAIHAVPDFRKAGRTTILVRKGYIKRKWLFLKVRLVFL